MAATAAEGAMSALHSMPVLMGRETVVPSEASIQKSLGTILYVPCCHFDTWCINQFSGLIVSSCSPVVAAVLQQVSCRCSLLFSFTVPKVNLTVYIVLLPLLRAGVHHPLGGGIPPPPHPSSCPLIRYMSSWVDIPGRGYPTCF